MWSHSRVKLPTSQILTCRHYRKAPEAASQEIKDLLTRYTAYPPRPLNLSTLLSFGRPLTPESVLRSVSFALSEIPRRLATRLRSLEALPFVVGTNPYVANTLYTYRESFRCLATYPPVKDLAENAKFAAQLEALVGNHANDIPIMAKGFQECSRYMSHMQISKFLDGAIRNRISVRLIAEQHIALSQAIKSPETNPGNVGIVDVACSPSDMIKMCGSFVADLCDATLGASPAIVIDGHVHSTFAYVPIHLEYILTEILKNSFRATVERQHRLQRSSTPKLPPVVITISPPPSVDSHNAGTSFLSMRVRDQGGGVSPNNMARIFSYAFTTAGRGAESRECNGNMFCEITGKGLQTGIGTIAGLGYGLPMSRLYSKYFGGSLDLVSLDGWGSDVFLKLRCLDEAGDADI